MLGENKDITYFAETDSRNRRVPFGIKTEDRSRHVYIIGKTGMGKSTVLENMAVQDIINGNGLAFLDPHGKSADLLLQYVPEHRMKDVIYFAPFDTDFPISFNVMEDVGADKRHLVVNGLMSAFKKIWVDAWSARMEYILNNTLLALLEYPDSTLIGVNRMFADKDYRQMVVETITDPSVKKFWVDEFAKYNDRYAQEATAAIQNKVGQFISNPLVRNIIGQPKSTFNLRQVMDGRKIIIINLSKGRLGEANANLLGSMIITKIYLAALSRADSSEKMLEGLPPFNLYVDEFQNFANESFADILSEARKYKLNLTIAHQYIEQMSEEVRAAVFGNVGTMITFRVGAYDAEILEKEFAPQFTIEDLVNLGKYQIYLKLMIDGVSSAAFSAATIPQIERPIISHAEEIIDHSRKSFARPREVVEDEIRIWHGPLSSAPKTSFSGPGRERPQFLKNDSRAPRLPEPPLGDSPAPSAGGRAGGRQTAFRPPDRSAVSSPKPSFNERRVMTDHIPKDVPDVRTMNPRPPRPDMRSQVATDERERELRKAISLDYLKKKPEAGKAQGQAKNDKVQTPEHVAALKAALSQVMKKLESAEKRPEQQKHDNNMSKPHPEHVVQPKIERPDQQNNQATIQNQNNGPAKIKPHSAEAATAGKQNEIPEDVLRDMLKVEE